MLGDLIAQSSPGSVPSELTALGIVVTVVGWMIWRFNRSDAEDREEKRATLMAAAQCEEKLDLVRSEVAEQRRLKHQVANDLAVARGQVVVARRCAKGCTCEAMVPFLLLVEPE